jgi:hypothetical protein
MTLAATKVITVTAMNVLATAAMHFPSDPPSSVPPTQTRLFVLTASSGHEDALATPNRLIAASLELPSAAGPLALEVLAPHSDVAR